MLTFQSSRGLLSATLVAVALLIWARYIEPRILTVTRMDVEIEGLAAGLDGTRILLISDLHGERFGDGQSRLRALIARERPDVLVFAGDLVDYDRGGLEAGVELLQAMADHGPLVVVWGNHDHELDLPGIRAAVEASVSAKGLVDLEKKPYHLLKLDGGTIVFAAVPRSWTTRVPSVKPAITEATAAAPAGSPVVVVMHSPGPEKVQAAAAAGADLILAGHTHGGQIRAPVIGALWVPGQGLRPPLAWGLYRVQAAWVFVTRGLGTSVLPVRFFCPPEVVVLTLRPKGR